MTRSLEDNVNVEELIGAVDHDISHDPFPVKGIDYHRLHGGQRQAGRPLLLDRVRHDLRRLPGPETGSPDYAEYVLTSGAARFAITGPCAPAPRAERATPSTATASTTSRWKCPMSTPPTRHAIGARRDRAGRAA